MKVKDMTFDIDCRNVQEYNKMRIGDQVFLIIEEYFSFIENLYNMKAVKYYTIDQYYRYENTRIYTAIIVRNRRYYE